MGGSGDPVVPGDPVCPVTRWVRRPDGSGGLMGPVGLVTRWCPVTRCVR